MIATWTTIAPASVDANRRTDSAPSVHRGDHQGGGAFGHGLREQIDRCQGPCHSLARGLGEEEPGIAGRQHRDDDRRPHKRRDDAREAQPRGGDPRAEMAPCAVKKYAPQTIHDRQFGRIEDVVEAFGRSRSTTRIAAVTMRKHERDGRTDEPRDQRASPSHHRIAVSSMVPVAIPLVSRYKAMSRPHGFSCGVS